MSWRLSRAGSPPLCLFGRGLARRYVLLVHARARISKAAKGCKSRANRTRLRPMEVSGDAPHLCFLAYVIFASCSASSSQLLRARMTFSLAGIPFGKSV